MSEGLDAFLLPGNTMRGCEGGGGGGAGAGGRIGFVRVEEQEEREHIDIAIVDLIVYQLLVIAPSDEVMLNPKLETLSPKP